VVPPEIAARDRRATTVTAAIDRIAAIGVTGAIEETDRRARR
jgi:hypothetical protein